MKRGYVLHIELRPSFFKIPSLLSHDWACIYKVLLQFSQHNTTHSLYITAPVAVDCFFCLGVIRWLLSCHEAAVFARRLRSNDSTIDPGERRAARCRRGREERTSRTGTTVLSWVRPTDKLHETTQFICSAAQSVTPRPVRATRHAWRAVELST